MIVFIKTRFYVNPHTVYKVPPSLGKTTCTKQLITWIRAILFLLISSHIGTAFNNTAGMSHQKKECFSGYFGLSQSYVQNQELVFPKMWEVYDRTKIGSNCDYFSSHADLVLNSVGHCSNTLFSISISLSVLHIMSNTNETNELLNWNV